MTTVGWTYFTGEHGAPQDNDEAMYWNQKASDAGFTVASYNIGFFYYSGLAGLEQDLIMARKYWLLSASQWLNSEGLHQALEAKEAVQDQEMSKVNYENQVIEVTDSAILLDALVVSIERQKGPTQYTQIELSNGLKLLKKWPLL